jgi:hypothetical protein
MSAWDKEDFEDVVARALVACFEHKVKRNRLAGHSRDTLREEHYRAMVGSSILYVPNGERVALTPDRRGGCGMFDTLNDAPPASGLLAIPSEAPSLPPGTYLLMVHFERVKALGRGWSQPVSGKIYLGWFIYCRNSHVQGDRKYCVLTPDGLLVPCHNIATRQDALLQWHEIDVNARCAESFAAAADWTGVAMQLEADRRFCWTITAREKFARVRLGVGQEEIKSLLYARSLPMTKTGRKRPILHLVEAHRRRMRNGTDIDVTAFLRGSAAIEMDGTHFQVVPPAVIRPEVSKRSERYFDTAVAA